MNDDVLKVTFLEKATKRLDEGLVLYNENQHQAIIRDGLIQRFEFSYEMVCKTLKRYLEKTAPAGEMYDMMDFPDIIRSCNEKGLLLSDWPMWRHYRDMRNKTAHTYDEKIALEVVKDIPLFLREMQYLLAQLKSRLSP